MMTQKQSENTRNAFNVLASIDAGAEGARSAVEIDAVIARARKYLNDALDEEYGSRLLRHVAERAETARAALIGVTLGTALGALLVAITMELARWRVSR